MAFTQLLLHCASGIIRISVVSLCTVLKVHSYKGGINSIKRIKPVKFNNNV